MNFLKKQLRQSYHIGFLPNVPHDYYYRDNVIGSIRWIKDWHYKNGWFADPFIERITDSTIEVLAEEFVYATKKGRISLIIIDKKDLNIREVYPILELKTHLSFPHIIKYEGKSFVYPENCEGGSVKIYEYDRGMKRLISPHVLINEELVDVQILFFKEQFYLFGVKHEDDKRSYEYTKELHIYKSNNLFGPYKFFQKIKSHTKTERGAGAFFIVDNKIIRPAQNCEGGYGRGVIFYELDQIEDGEFYEKKIGSIRPGLNRYPLQLHTFNIKDDYTVIDGFGYTAPLLRWPLSVIHLLARKFKR